MKFIKTQDEFLNEGFRQGKVTYYNVNVYGNEIKTAEDLISILNTFDNYAEMSDNPKKGNEMYSVKQKVDKWINDNSFDLKKIEKELNQKGKTAIERYFT